MPGLSRTVFLQWRNTPSAPVQAGFLASLLLSLVAVLSNPVPNRDGMMYVSAARIFFEEGFSARIDFDWSFYPLLIAGIGRMTGLDLEWVAYALNALFLAGASALIIDLVRRSAPGAAWAACLVMLALPGHNSYRDFIIREFGYWFFIALAFWLAGRWQAHGHRWREALAVQGALACAALFRLEAVVFFPALVLWQAFSAPRAEKISRCLKITLLPLLGSSVLLMLFLSGTLPVPQRFRFYLDAANLLEGHVTFRNAAEGLAAELPELSRRDAGFILLAGLLMLVPVKLIKTLGIFVVPLGYAACAGSVRSTIGRWNGLPWAFLFHVLSLGGFAAHQLFVSGRYVTTLGFLVAPMAATGLSRLLMNRPAIGKAVVVLALVTMFANVVSISPGKSHLKHAGHWLAQNVTDSTTVYVQDQTVAYLAGWPYRHGLSGEFDPVELNREVAGHHFDLLVLIQSHKQTSVPEWIQENRLTIVQKFENRAHDVVWVVKPPR